jgi:hypothetical protein
MAQAAGSLPPTVLSLRVIAYSADALVFRRCVFLVPFRLSPPKSVWQPMDRFLTSHLPVACSASSSRIVHHDIRNSFSGGLGCTGGRLVAVGLSILAREDLSPTPGQAGSW